MFTFTMLGFLRLLLVLAVGLIPHGVDGCSFVPQLQTVNVGQRVTVTCRSGDDENVYIFIRKITNLTDFEPIVANGQVLKRFTKEYQLTKNGPRSHVLTITRVTMEHAGYFICYVNEGIEDSSCTTVLNVTNEHVTPSAGVCATAVGVMFSIVAAGVVLVVNKRFM